MPRRPNEYLDFADRRIRAFGRQVSDRVSGPPFAHPEQRAELVAAIADTRPLLERLLVENLVDFWFPACIDEAGGYRFDRDEVGFVPARAHRTISVARTVWFFAAMSRSRWGAAGHRDAATHGMQTLRDILWDDDHGGFFYETDARGRPTIDAKTAYAHAFALSAVAEMAEVTADPEILAFADDVFGVYEDHLHDEQFAGYREVAGVAWQTLTDDVPQIRYASPRHKTLNGLVHVTEAMVAYTRCSRSSLAITRSAELAHLLGETTVHDPYGVGIDTYAPDWTPMMEYQWPRIAVSYGHEAERVAVLGRAADLLGLPMSPVHQRLQWIVQNQLRWGWDRVRGGVFLSGALAGPAWDPAKVWWVQAESMITYLDLFVRTGDMTAGQAYLAILRWIDHHQVDWEGGEWFARIEPFGRITAPKTDVWKTPFHIGRSLLLALGRLEDLELDEGTLAR